MGTACSKVLSDNEWACVRGALAHTERNLSRKLEVGGLPKAERVRYERWGRTLRRLLSEIHSEVTITLTDKTGGNAW